MPQYNDAYVYFYFLMSTPRGISITPYYYIISSNYLVGQFITHLNEVGILHYYLHITIMIPLGTSLGTLHSIPLPIFHP